MRISIQACIEGEGAEPSKVITVGLVEREDSFAPASGLGLFMRETHALLKQLQTVVLDEQVDRFVAQTARCLACGARLGIKDTKRLVYRTTFGKASLRSPRFYSHCSACGFCSSDKATVSPLAHALPQRVHPQWSWLQCRYASVMSYRLAQIFLRDAFPGGSQLSSSSVKAKPVTVLCDGGDDISFACKLPSATARVLDWFHIGMRFQHLLMVLPGLRGADADAKYGMRRRVIKAKWLLWHGQQARCLERLESLRRDTGWAGARNPLGG